MRVTARTWTGFIRGFLASCLAPALLFPAVAAAQDCDPPVETKLVASPSDIGDAVGLRVALDGDTAVLGAQGSNPGGAAFVFFRESGGWSQQARLSFPGTTGADQFGNQVAIDGDSIVVAAHRFDSQDRGLVVPYERNGTNWVQQSPLTAPFVQNGQRFGSSVALDADTLVVGATHDNAVGSRSGAAYVFVRDQGAWTFQQRLVPDSGSSLFFGVEVAVDGDTVLVGATSDSAPATQSGAVYVFTRSGVTWTRQQKLAPSELTVSSNLGRVSIQGDTAVVASSDVRIGDKRGAAFVYTRTGTVWTRQQVLTASDGVTGQSFGNLVAIDGDRILVGAQSHNGAVQRAGAGYVFARQGGVWVQQLRLTASDPFEGAEAGIGIGLSGDTALLGAYQATLVPGGDRVGAAYAFDLPDATCPPTRVLPRATKGAMWVKKAKASVRDGVASVSVDGFMDLGPDGGDLGVGADMDIGDSYVELPEDVEPDGKGRYRFQGEGVLLLITPSKRGSSLAKFKLRAAGISLESEDGPLDVRFGGGGINAESSVGLVRGRYRGGKGALTRPPIAVTRLKAKVPREGDHRFTLLAQVPTDGSGETPEEPPVIYVAVGDVELDVPTADLVRNERKGTWEYRAPKGSDGITRVRVDYRRGFVTVSGDDVTLGEFEEGPAPLTVTFGIDGDVSSLQILVVRKGSSLRY